MKNNIKTIIIETRVLAFDHKGAFLSRTLGTPPVELGKERTISGEQLAKPYSEDLVKELAKAIDELNRVG